MRCGLLWATARTPGTAVAANASAAAPLAMKPRRLKPEVGGQQAQEPNILNRAEWIIVSSRKGAASRHAGEFFATVTGRCAAREAGSINRSAAAPAGR